MDKTKMELEAEIKRLREERDFYKRDRDEYRIEYQSMKQKGKETMFNIGSGDTIKVKNYSRATLGRRYENTLSHMDILLCDAKSWASHDCGVCDRYINILVSAFEACNQLCSRDLSDDFSTKHATNDPEKEKDHIFGKL